MVIAEERIEIMLPSNQRGVIGGSRISDSILFGKASILISRCKREWTTALVSNTNVSASYISGDTIFKNGIQIVTIPTASSILCVRQARHARGNFLAGLSRL